MKVALPSSHMVLFHSWTFIVMKVSNHRIHKVSIANNIRRSEVPNAGMGEGVEETEVVMFKRKLQFTGMVSYP